MKQSITIIAVVSVLCAVIPASAGTNEWSSSGPWGGKAAWIWINGGAVYTEIAAGLYRSTDGGATWEYYYGGVAHDTRSMWCHNNYSDAFPNIMYAGG